MALAALRMEIPCFNQIAPLMVGPLTVLGITPCLQCALDTMGTEMGFRSMSSATVTDISLSTAKLPGIAPRVLGWGSIAAWEVARFLPGFLPLLVHRES